MMMDFVGGSVAYAFSQLKTDKVRTFLSLLGVCVGIFSTVAVFTLLDSLENSVKEGFDDFGSEMVFVERTPMEIDSEEAGEFKWWEYANRPQVSFREYEYLKSNSRLCAGMLYLWKSDIPAGNGALLQEEGQTVAVEGEWSLLVRQGIRQGRAFTVDEMHSGADVMLLGSDAAGRLGVAAGDRVECSGRLFTVVGVFDYAGDSPVSLTDVDNVRMIPYRSAARLIPAGMVESSIYACALPSAGQDEFIEELRTLMRSVRRTSPGEKDDFAVNRLSFVVDEITEIFSMVDKLGLVTGLFSLLVGGFGIANIMFVSVKERTREIGVQKALGAGRGRITLQFLTEAAALSSMGGILGLLLVWAGAAAIPDGMIEVSLSLANVARGMLIAVGVGVAAGVIPARFAASLRPVEAING